MFQGGSNYENEISQNAPNQSLMYQMYTPTFGNGAFMIQPPNPGEIADGFPTIPYLSIEALIYQQQASNPMTSPVYLQSGQHIGQQNIAGSLTSQDSLGTSRYSMGFQPGGQ